jgi:hypothetical protein
MQRAEASAEDANLGPNHKPVFREKGEKAMATKKCTLAILFLAVALTNLTAQEFNCSMFNKGDAGCSSQVGGDAVPQNPSNLFNAAASGLSGGGSALDALESSSVGSGSGTAVSGGGNLTSGISSEIGGSGPGGDVAGVGNKWWQGIITPFPGMPNSGAGAYQPFLDIGNALGRLCGPHSVNCLFMTALTIPEGEGLGGPGWSGPTRVGIVPNTLDGYETGGGSDWGGLGTDHTFDVIDLRSGRNIGTITGWQNAETGVARVEFANIKQPFRGGGLGAEGYRLWENALPKSIKRVTLSARVTPDAQGRIPRDFWLQMGFRDSGLPIQADLEGDQFVTMVKNIR